MIRGYYTATAGAITENRNLSVIANNVANLNTAGYKRDVPRDTTFAAKLLTRLAMADSGAVGQAVFGRRVEETWVDFTQGGFAATERTLDFAVRGEGFFAVEREDGAVLWTRNGEFALDADGNLVHVRGGNVLDVNGAPIRLGGADFTADSEGGLYENGQLTAQIGLFATADNAALLKAEDGFFTAPEDAVPQFAQTIVWQSLERSNTNMTKEMSLAMVSAREFQTYSRIMKMLDETTGQTVTEIGRPV
ncbi:MAG: flagellar hook-basal body complex protein [Gracilibacteraceae bacterium]|jgi:flagellar basal-body rod protein FlgG|nr:flagellar hook-basal body complex protein [Gracilibacteraceae bacterium]